MSGLLWARRLPVTELFRGFTDPPKNGLVETMTPPETGVGPEGTLPEIWLPVTSMSVAPRSGMPIPEKFAPHCAARHERVLFSTVLPFTSKSSTGSDGKPSKNMPVQLLWIVFPAKKPRWASTTDAPRAARDVVANERGTRTDKDIDAWDVGFRVGFRAAYNMVLRHSGVDAPESGDRASDIAYETVSYNSSVASAENVDHERRPLE